MGELYVEYLCAGGLTAASGLELLKNKLPEIIRHTGKPVFVYVWVGTCDITKKISTRYISVKKTGDQTPAQLMRKFRDIRDYILSIGGKLKFIGLPIYSVSVYNDNKGHKDVTCFLTSDKEVASHVN